MTASLQNSPGVEEARRYYLAKNFGAEIPLPVTHFDYNFGLTGLLSAGFNLPEQFVGSYQVNIFPDENGTVDIYVVNVTSMTSASYHILPSWNGGMFGNQTQIYHWTEILSQ